MVKRISTEYFWFLIDENSSMKHSDHIKQKIEKAIDQYKNGLDLSSRSTAELLESINIYHQELEYQND